jgi:hypothetical protein
MPLSESSPLIHIVVMGHDVTFGQREAEASRKRVQQALTRKLGDQVGPVVGATLCTDDSAFILRTMSAPPLVDMQRLVTRYEGAPSDALKLKICAAPSCIDVCIGSKKRGCGNGRLAPGHLRRTRRQYSSWEVSSILRRTGAADWTSVDTPAGAVVDTGSCC